MAAIQFREARRLLPIIQEAVERKTPLNYGTAAAALGRDPSKNARMVAQLCDLLDAAAAYAGVPLLALIAVTEKSGRINRKAWTAADLERDHREAILSHSMRHQFSADDFKSISDALTQLGERSNKAAWRLVRERIPPEQLVRQLAGLNPPAHFDAIFDIGTDAPERISIGGTGYARDPKIREAVKKRADGKCEHCGEPGFLCVDGTRYLECHHIIALAKDGADRMNNVIALCPSHHREAHFGQRRDELEAEMMRRVQSFDPGQASGRTPILPGIVTP